jgi:glutamyl-tRNA reductase
VLVVDFRYGQTKLNSLCVHTQGIVLMNLVLVGISHKTAPVEQRERFAIADRRIPDALKKLQGEAEIDEALIISTCNRVEFVLVGSGEADAFSGLRRFLKSFLDLSFDDFSHLFYVRRGYEAVRHLFRVASGLDSMVVGEPQVLGQVKQAYFQAKDAETVGPVLDAIFPRTFNVAKRIRTETSVAESAVSVSSAAVELAEKVLGDLKGKTVMIVGAGQMGELAARHLVARGASTLLVSNRTYAHAVALAQELKGLAIHFNEIWEAMSRADIVISSTGCPHYIVTREDMERLMGLRGGRPLFLMDIAVPRDIDPAVRDVEGCSLADVDGLQQVAAQNLKSREKALEAADRIVAEEAEQFRERQEALSVVPTILSLRRRFEEIRRAELARTRRLFGGLTPQQERALEILTQGLVNKFLHAPFSELKQASSRPDRTEFLTVVRTIFRLEDEGAEAETSPERWRLAS